MLIPFAAGLAAPYLLTCAVLFAAGVFPAFWFWTVSYGSQYGTSISFDSGLRLLREALRIVASPDMPFWILPWFGFLVIWWDRRVAVAHRVLLAVLLGTSIGTVTLGFYFRDHYFITLLPVMALLTGAAANRSAFLIRQDRTIELTLVIPVVILLFAGICASLIGNGSIWFAASPERASREIYGSTLPKECLAVADYLQAHAAKDARVAILGSEPQISFYSKRRGASGYIYMYPLMETHAYAAKMQDNLISEIEKGKPDWFVYVDDARSWLRMEASERRLDDWWTSYWSVQLDLVQTITFETGLESIESLPDLTGGHSVATPAKVARVMVLKRKGANDLGSPTN